MDLQLAIGLAFHGSAGPMAIAFIAGLTAKISATGQNLPVIPSTAATLGSPWPTRATAFIYLPTMAMPRLLRCFAPACSATVLIDILATRVGSAFTDSGTRPI